MSTLYIPSAWLFITILTYIGMHEQSHSFQYGCACFTCSSRWLPLIHIAWIHVIDCKIFVMLLQNKHSLVNRMSTYVKKYLNWYLWRWGATHLWAALHITLHLISSVTHVTIMHSTFLLCPRAATQTQQSCLASTKHRINTAWRIETIIKGVAHSVNSFLVVYSCCHPALS